MHTSLPKTSARALEQTLNQWRQWQCDEPLQKAPAVVSVLSGGVSNFSVLVEAQTRFVVRLDGATPAQRGLNRLSEWRIMRTAWQAGIAPRPCYCNPDLGSLVCNYLEPATTDVLNDGDQLAHIAALLRNIHALPARHQRLDLAERILRHEKQREHQGKTIPTQLHNCGPAIKEILLELQPHDEASVLCHNDLLRANRIYSNGQLWAIDWEYSAMGSPWYDLAAVIHGDEMGTAEEKVLVEAYLGRAAEKSELYSLHLYAALYCYLELLWYLAQPEQTLDAATMSRKTTHLEALLAAGPQPDYVNL